MTSENPITTFFNVLFTGNFLGLIANEPLDSTADNQQEIERYQREVQRFNAIHHRHKEILEEQDKLLGDDELSL